MRYVILRDDDTNAFTPVECLERLYRPFLERGLPVNLATIPAVSANATMADGQPEGFLQAGSQAGLKPQLERAGERGGDSLSPQLSQGRPCGDKLSPPPMGKDAGASEPDNAIFPIGMNQELVRYLLANPGYKIVQHGCHHDYLEFECPARAEASRRLELGTKLLMEAGFPRPQTFVAPYDKLSKASLLEVGQRFRVLSTGWFELGRLPRTWWPQYAARKFYHTPHWRVGQLLLLSHPGCLLSCHRAYSTMLGGILHYLSTQRLTVLVTHWWEYFRDQKPDEEFIGFLHETASYLGTHPELKVISFSDLLAGQIPLN